MNKVDKVTGKIIDKLLHMYDSSNFIIRSNARFILYLILTLLVISPLMGFYYSFLHLHNPVYNNQIQLRILGPILIAIMLILIVLAVLLKGYFSIAGNLLLIIIQSTIWVVIFLSGSETITRVDTIVLVVASLTMMPVVIVRRKILFIFYTLINIFLIIIFMAAYKNDLNISGTAFTDFISDNSFAIIFVGITSYAISSINSRALKKAKTEIDERKKAEEQRNRLQMQLLQSQKLESVGLLAGGVAHDFNNMLAAIQGFAELASDNVDGQSPAKSEIDEIIRASKKARDLTQQLLAFARIQPLDMQLININRVITDFAGMLSRTLRGNIKIQKNLCGNPGSIEGDPVRIEQVILNLILNSQDAMPEGGTVVIETSHVNVEEDFVKRFENISPGPYLLLSISDSGTGIDPDFIERIFDPFFTTKDSGKGTGLGLSTVYGIIKQHRGMIHVYSEIEKGTIFKIYLPLIDKKEETDSTPPADLNFYNGNETVLAVEDNPEVRNLLETILKKYGYNAFIAGNAETALTIASSYEGIIHLLITDVIIPDMNGMLLFNKINEIRPGIKAIFISGYTASVIAQNDSIDNGINFIQKPFSVTDLTRKIREVLDS